MRAVVLAHAGSTFCSGADLKEAATEGGPGVGTQRMLDLLQLVLDLPKPVIARVDGAARAGGLGIIGACDLAFASGNATFAFSEVRIGVSPAIISLTTLGRMGDRAAARHLLTGEPFAAPAAAAAGLITAAVEDLDAELAAVGAQLRRSSPQALAATKPLTNRATRALLAAHGAEMAALSARLFAGAEAREGMRAFLGKRPPAWAHE